MPGVLTWRPPAQVNGHSAHVNISRHTPFLHMSFQEGPEPGLASSPQSPGLDDVHLGAK